MRSVLISTVMFLFSLPALANGGFTASAPVSKTESGTKLCLAKLEYDNVIQRIDVLYRVGTDCADRSTWTKISFQARVTTTGATLYGTDGTVTQDAAVTFASATAQGFIDFDALITWVSTKQ